MIDQARTWVIMAGRATFVWPAIFSNIRTFRLHDGAYRGARARDRAASPVPGLYNICYVNGFQTQPGDGDRFSGLILTDADGEPVVDPDWPDEFILDTSTPANRDALVGLLTPTLRMCADKGYQAVEFDNFDSFTRSHGGLGADDNLAFAGKLIGVAHGMGLQAGQKNAAEYTTAGRTAGFDFAVAEECAQYDECGSYTAVYGARVVDIEYTDNLDGSFDDVCAAADQPAMTILRDRYLRAPQQSDYTYEHC